MLTRVPLDRVQDNPYQTRIEYGDLTELADSILRHKAARPDTSGLIAVPPARVVLDSKVLDPRVRGGVDALLKTVAGAMVQIAAGHRRLRAWRQLAETDPDYRTFPVEVFQLDDRTMADLSWTENYVRQDLSPVEQARALQRAIDDFGYTQEEIGQRWGLSRSAVANKLRLLDLPDDAQRALRAGAITERHGRTLLTAAARSPAVYRQVADQLLPLDVPPEAAEKAAELGDRDFETYPLDPPEGGTCAACRRPFGAGEKGHRSQKYGSDGWISTWLCRACYRVAIDWSPPTVADTAAVLQTAVRANSVDLSRAPWPLDTVVGQGDPRVHDPQCGGCLCRQVTGDRQLCLDRDCYDAKVENWEGYQDSLISQHLQATYGATVPIVRTYGGDDLSNRDGVDLQLLEERICAPGKCDRLRLRHCTYKDFTAIYPLPDLPYVWNCNNGNSHNACRKRYLKAKRDEDEIAAEKLAKKTADGRRDQARDLLDRAAASVARALASDHSGAWAYLARHHGAKIEPGGAADTSRTLLAARLLTERFNLQYFDWKSEDSVDRFTARVKEYLADAMGLSLPAGLDDLLRKLERIERFIYETEELTLDQISGNIDNLNDLLDALGQLREADQLTAPDYERVSGRVHALLDVLVA